ncbi:MAG: putative lipid II flippase FtsW [Oscillospiraceae bacterium]|nr:putative lipid II flippase FtsW [Oscillospiraceae bacterium]
MQDVRPRQQATQPEARGEDVAYGHIDLPFLLLMLAISAIGIIMMFSASYASAVRSGLPPSYFFLRQGQFYLAGLVIMGILSRVNYQIYKMAAPFILVGVTVLLALVLIAGESRGGARRWFNLGFQFQPSELAKLGIVIIFATMIVMFGRRMEKFKYGVLPFGFILLLFCGLVLLQPHLSGAIIIGSAGMAMMFVGGVKKRFFAILIAGGTTAAFLAWQYMPHVRSRIRVWQDPFIAPRGAGFQPIQSLYAIGPGGLFGLGLGQSRQKFGSLPERHNDYIFSIVAEELGFVGASLIIILFILLIWRGFWLALQMRDRFGKLLVCGIMTLLSLQTFLNIGVVTNLLPATGVSMPFFSYGGTALVVQLAQMGIVLNVSKYIPAKREG